MAQIETEEISLDEIYQLAFNVFSNNGCDKEPSLSAFVTVRARAVALSESQPLLENTLNDSW